MNELTKSLKNSVVSSVDLNEDQTKMTIMFNDHSVLTINSSAQLIVMATGPLYKREKEYSPTGYRHQYD